MLMVGVAETSQSVQTRLRMGGSLSWSSQTTAMPVAVAPNTTDSDAMSPAVEPKAASTFDAIDVDPRMLRALRNFGFRKTTSVQAQAIPSALGGADLLVRARTGSGKTLAYCVPLVQKVLQSAAATTAIPSHVGADAANSGARRSIAAVVLVPTKELADQVTRQLVQLATYCREEVVPVNFAAVDLKSTSLYSYLADSPNIIVGTPSKILPFLEKGAVVFDDTFDTLVLDEADLILSYGYDADVRRLLEFMPTMCQKMLMSATLSDDVESLTQLILRNPVTITVEDTTGNDSILEQYYTKCAAKDKYLLAYFIFKLKVHPFGSGRTLVFVNDVEACYKLKLFLEQFGVKSCALNSSIPVQSRFHVVQQFNRGLYDIIIATDEDFLTSSGEKTEKKEGTKEKAPKGKKASASADYSVVRGIDFQNVRCVINFDVPTSVTSYVHRIGRTARGVGNRGFSLTIVANDEDINQPTVQKKAKLTAVTQAQTEADILDAVIAHQKEVQRDVNEFQFDMDQVNGFRYRVEDALRTVTPAHIKESRLKELKSEVMNSEKLKAHFEDNPTDLEALRHDKPLHTIKVQQHLKHVPDYLQPNKSKIVSGNTIKYVPFRMKGRHNSSKKSARGRGPTRSGGVKKRSDPLKFRK